MHARWFITKERPQFTEDLNADIGEPPYLVMDLDGQIAIFNGEQLFQLFNNYVEAVLENAQPKETE